MNKIKSSDIQMHFERKFHDSAKHLVAFEVNEGTGSTAGRRADAVSLELWPSNGYELIGYEFKVSRADWLQEMKQPEKSQAISKYCDRWYLVAPKGVLGIDELPPSWGYIQVSDKSLRTKIDAPKRSAEPASREFMASLLRRMLDKYQDARFIATLTDKIRKEQQSIAEKTYENQVKSSVIKQMEQEEIIKSFEHQSGIHINKYNLGNITKTVRLLSNSSNMNAAKREVYSATHRLSKTLDDARAALEELEIISINLNGITELECKES